MKRPTDLIFSAGAENGCTIPETELIFRMERTWDRILEPVQFFLVTLGKSTNTN